jgi:hypothetical protein
MGNGRAGKLRLLTYAGPSFRKIVTKTIARSANLTAFLALTAGNDHIWASSESGTHHGWIYEYAYPSGGLPLRRIQPGDFINGIAITPYATPG